MGKPGMRNCSLHERDDVRSGTPPLLRGPQLGSVRLPQHFVQHSVTFASQSMPRENTKWPRTSLDMARPKATTRRPHLAKRVEGDDVVRRDSEVGAA